MFEELKRKSIHLIGLLIPICYYFVDRQGFYFINSRVTAIIILFTLTIVYFSIELLRFANSRFQRLFLNHLSGLLRSHERRKITATGYYLISASLSVLLFEKELAIACLSFLVLGDMFAALVGMQWGRTKIIAKKSLEGSLACLGICLAIGLFVAWLFHFNPRIIFIGAFTATVVELLPLGIDDNLTIPLISGLVMQLLIHFML